MGCPVVCGRRDKEFIIASVSKRYQNLEKKSLFFFVVVVGVLVASHFDTKIRCERFSKIEDKRESLTNTWTCVMFIALILFLSVCCLSLSLSACVSLCVRVFVLFYVCLCYCSTSSLSSSKPLWCCFFSSIPRLFQCVYGSPSSFESPFPPSRTRERLPLFLFCSSRTSPRLSDDFPNDFPTTKGARVLACVLWCWCWCWYSARNEELMKIRARARRDAFESNGTLVVQKKIRRDSNGKERRRRRILVHDFLASWSGARPIASLVLFFVFFFSFFVSIQIFPPSL